MEIYFINNEYYVVEESKEKAIKRFNEFSNDEIKTMEKTDKGMVVWKGDAKTKYLKNIAENVELG